jgi:hypothetical protein
MVLADMSASFLAWIKQKPDHGGHMRVNDLGSPKKLILGCLAVFGLLYFFGHPGPAKPVLLHGVVAALQEQDGQIMALAVDSQGERFVVKVSAPALARAPLPELRVDQEVDLRVTAFKGQKQGITCDYVELVKAGPIREGSTPDGDKTLPVDDLKTFPALKGM